MVSLGLESNLAEYKVPREDLPGIAERAMGSKESPAYGKVIRLLESLYPQ